MAVLVLTRRPNVIPAEIISTFSTRWMCREMGSGFRYVLLFIFIFSLLNTGKQDLPPYPQDLLRNRDYWLIGTSLKERKEPYSRKERLLKFDGNEVENMTRFLTPANKYVCLNNLSWNGEYFLIKGYEVVPEKPFGFGANFFYRYDGNTFTDLTADLNMALQPRETPQPQKSGFSILIFFISLIVIFASLWYKFKKL